MDKKGLFYILPVALLILGLVVGFVIGGKVDINKIGKTVSQSPQVEVSRLYTSQTAIIRGQITAVNDQTLSVKNTNGSTGNLRASNRILIVKFNTSPSKAASPSSDLKTIEMNKDVLLNLEMVNGTYEVTQVQYIAPGPKVPSPPPGEL